MTSRLLSLDERVVKLDTHLGGISWRGAIDLVRGTTVWDFKRVTPEGEPVVGLFDYVPVYQEDKLWVDSIEKVDTF